MNTKTIIITGLCLIMLINPVLGTDVGIKINVGIPEIQYASCADGVCTILIKNIGDSPGAFHPSFTGAPGTDFSMKYVSKNIVIEPNEIITLKVHVYANSNEGKPIGIVKVTDLHDSRNFDTQEVYMSMSLPKICVPNDVRVTGSTIYQCNKDGTKEDLIINCENGYLLNDGRIENSGWYCKENKTETPVLNPFIVISIIIILSIIMKKSKGEQK